MMSHSDQQTVVCGFISALEQRERAEALLNSALLREKNHSKGQAVLGAAVARFAISSPDNASTALKLAAQLDLTLDEKRAVYPLLKEIAELATMHTNSEPQELSE